MPPIDRTIILSLVLLASIAPAQPVEPDHLQSYVAAVTVPDDGQVGRFHDPVCVAAEGMPPDHEAVIEARISEVAEAAGVPLDRRAHCLPNLFVLIADDGEDVAGVIRRRRPELLAGLRSVDVDRATSGQGAVHGWRSSRLTSGVGEPIADQRDGFLAQDVHLHNGNTPASLVRTTTRRALTLSIVVFDLDAIDGLTLMQVADHAALRGLAPTRPAPITAGRSILGLFEGSKEARPPSLTRLDLAYLRALYRIGGAMGAVEHERLVARLAAIEMASR